MIKLFDSVVKKTNGKSPIIYLLIFSCAFNYYCNDYFFVITLVFD